MRKSDRNLRVRDTVLMSGWLFADLLLALAIIFLAANTMGVKIPRPLSTPTPTPTPTPTLIPTPERLDFNYEKIFLTVDNQGLLSNSSQAIKDFKQKIEGQIILKGGSVGLAIVYGGAPGDNNIGYAEEVGNKVISILKSLAHDGYPAFQRASYYGSIYVLRNAPSFIEIDIFLFKK